MASNKVRYFRSRVDGGTTTGDYLEGNPNYTEVQVAPHDAIVIRRDELPEVSPSSEAAGCYNVRTDSGVHAYRPRSGLSPTEPREVALAWLSIAEHEREHPPVDEAQVRKLADILKSTGEGTGSWEGHAKALLRAGVRVGVA